MKIDLDPIYQKIVKDIISKYLPGVEIWVFGSRVTGNAKKFSDLDLVVITSKPIPLKLMTSINDAFSESELPIKVDLVDWSTISESFKTIILKKYQILFPK